jgi:Na+-driven multidrug efflux pump
MEESFQIAFNIIVFGLIFVIGLAVSFASKVAKSVGINPDKEKKEILTETIGVGVVLLFIIFGIFATSYWGG